MITFTNEILNGKLHFLCSVKLSFFTDIAESWKGVPNNLDAAVAFNGSNYFFKGCTVYVYSSQSNRVERTVNMGQVFEIPCNISAAVIWKQGNIYFFKGNVFYEYPNNKNTNFGSPTAISTLSPFLDSVEDIEAAVFWQGHSYLFKGTIYYRGNEGSLSTTQMIVGWPSLYESDLMPKCGCGCTADTVVNFKENWRYDSFQYEINLGTSSPSCSTVLTDFVIDNRNISSNFDKEFTVSTKFTESVSFSYINGISLPSGTTFRAPQPDYKDNVIISNSTNLQNFTYGSLTMSSTNSKSFVYNCPSFGNMKVTCTVTLCKQRLWVPYTLNFFHKRKNCVCSSQILLIKEWTSHLHMSIKQAS